MTNFMLPLFKSIFGLVFCLIMLCFVNTTHAQQPAKNSSPNAAPSKSVEKQLIELQQEKADLKSKVLAGTASKTETARLKEVELQISTLTQQSIKEVPERLVPKQVIEPVKSTDPIIEN